MNATKVRISFANRPLQPGETIGFRLLFLSTTGASTSSFGFYNVLWDSTGSDRNNNAIVTANYSDGSILSSRFFDFPRGNQVFPLDNYYTSGESQQVDCGYET